ncbi:MAG: hypothetical protein ACW976_04020 [Candidatus Ranarchaeia archaeon]
MPIENRILVLKCESGAKDPVSIDPSLVNAKNVLIVLDELNKTVWLWVGESATMIETRTALRLAKGLKRSGLSYGNTVINSQAEYLTEIYEKDLDTEDKQNKRKLVQLLASIEKVPTDPNLGYIPKGMIPSVEVPEPLKEKEPATEDALGESLEMPPGIAPPVSKKEEKPSKPSKLEKEEEPDPFPVGALDSSINADVKAGLLLFSVLRQFSELYIVIQGNTIRIEGPTEPLTNFEISGNDLVVSPKLKFGGRQNEVLQLYKDLIKRIQ